ncbi:Ankyrin repeat-containing protein [Artemisia annua]|uniref:Ankyrin repeat-containing protein n=1 Tax=Artemisia annua TaxID=35608 RepID=A0A2U1L614_ARTAN|nr:Ankyrin repeat-containing protein [Artemisia annua]
MNLLVSGLNLTFDHFAGTSSRPHSFKKEVEAFMHSKYRTEKNTTGQTPNILLIKEHKKLVKLGEEWMKKTVDLYTAITVSINPHCPLC